MFPYRDHNPSDSLPIVTVGLIVINVAVFLYSLGINGQPLEVAGFYNAYALVPTEVLAGTDLSTLVTHMFLHAGFLHIIGNMLFLWIFGDNLEEAFGHVGFLLFYIAAGLVAAAGQIAANPGSQVPMVGASGAVAGVMGGYLLLFPKARVDVLLIFIVIVRAITMPAWVILGIWFGLQLFNGVSSLGSIGGGVAYWAHAAGFVAGAVLTLPIFLSRGGATFWQRTQGHPPHPPTEVGERPTTIPTVRRRR